VKFKRLLWDVCIEVSFTLTFVIMTFYEDVDSIDLAHIMV